MWLNISDSRHGNEYYGLSLQGIVLYLGGNKYCGLSLQGIVLYVGGNKYCGLSLQGIVLNLRNTSAALPLLITP